MQGLLEIVRRKRLFEAHAMHLLLPPPLWDQGALPIVRCTQIALAPGDVDILLKQRIKLLSNQDKKWVDKGAGRAPQLGGAMQHLDTTTKTVAFCTSRHVLALPAQIWCVAVRCGRTIWMGGNTKREHSADCMVVGCHVWGCLTVLT